MGYATLENVQSEFKDMVFTSTTTVTDADVNEFLAEADAYINSTLSKRYEVPIAESYADARLILRMYSRLLVAERVRKILAVKQETNSGANQQVRGMMSTADIIKDLKSYADGEKDLTGVDSNSGQNPFSATAGFGVEPVFKKDKVQW